MAVLLMDIRGAISQVAKGNLTNKMHNMGLKADLVGWVESLMEERKVILSMNGNKDHNMDMEMGVLLGSPVSPVLLLMYLWGLFKQVENKDDEYGNEGISFVDDVVWAVDEEGMAECIQRLRRCTKEGQSGV